MPENGLAKFQITGGVSSGDSLTSTKTDSDPDGDGVFSYSWKSSSDQSTWSQVSTNSSYTLTDSDLGKYLKLDINYTDVQGNSSSVLGTYGSQLSSHTKNNIDLTSSITFDEDTNGTPANIDIAKNGNITLGSFFDSFIIISKHFPLEKLPE